MTTSSPPEDALTGLKAAVDRLTAALDEGQPELERLRAAAAAAQQLAADELERRLRHQREIADLKAQVARLQSLRVLRYTRGPRRLYAKLRGSSRP